jgi:protein-S-isoprenylcysteine O-methyltransferase Ste14
MKATAWEFRHRFWIALAIYTLGFTVPWDAVHPSELSSPGTPVVWPVDGRGANAHVWGWLAGRLAQSGAMSFGAAFKVVLVAAIGCAVAGAWLRTWGTAYLGTDVMSDKQMRSDTVIHPSEQTRREPRLMAAGPYRYMRNPLYVGSWLNTLALTLLMRPSGAVFTLVALVGFHVRLILAEEAFLRAKLGEAYVAYCAQVPRIVPKLTSPKPTSQNRDVGHPVAKPRWDRAAVAEVYMWGSAAGFAVLGRRYDANLLLQCVLVSLGVALVVKGVVGRRGEKTQG